MLVLKKKKKCLIKEQCLVIVRSHIHMSHIGRFHKMDLFYLSCGSDGVMRHLLESEMKNSKLFPLDPVTASYTL